MINIDEALAVYDAHVEPLPTESRDLRRALGYTLAAELAAAIDLPPFTQSAMDGYAVITSDLDSASVTEPVVLNCVLTRAAGAADRASLKAGQCARIFTGAPLPSGADSVVIQEDVEIDGQRIKFTQSTDVAANVRARGEECASGQPLLARGTKLTPTTLALAAFAGHSHANVRRPPRVTVIVTGDELAQPGQTLRPGQVYECNGRFLSAWLAQQGCKAEVHSVRDDPELLASLLESALPGADLIVITGGASVGERDYGRAAAQACGISELFWRVAQKPGKPLWFGRADAVPVLILPGNPGSVFACVWVHVARVLDRLLGRTPGVHELGKLTEAVQADSRRERLLRARLTLRDGECRLDPLPGQASHMLTNLAQTTALVRITARAEYPAGTLARFIRCDAT